MTASSERKLRISIHFKSDENDDRVTNAIVTKPIYFQQPLNLLKNRLLRKPPSNKAERQGVLHLADLFRSFEQVSDA